MSTVLAYSSHKYVIRYMLTPMLVNRKLRLLKWLNGYSSSSVWEANKNKRNLPFKMLERKWIRVAFNWAVHFHQMGIIPSFISEPPPRWNQLLIMIRLAKITIHNNTSVADKITTEKDHNIAAREELRRRLQSTYRLQPEFARSISYTL